MLATLPRLPDNPWVIAGPRPGRRLSSLNGRWLVVRARAELEDVRIHDLRHSFASRALALGESLTMIGKLLGHRKVQTTARYAHLARESVKTSAARVAESIAADIGKPPTAPVADSNGLTTWKSVDLLCREGTQPCRLVHSKKTAAGVGGNGNGFCRKRISGTGTGY